MISVEVYGHDAVRQALEAFLPPVALLRGPSSVGKWTLCEHLLQHYQVQVADRLLLDARSDHRAALSMSEEKDLPHGTVGQLVSFARIAPFGRRKVVVARLDYASEAALNALLKLLEEPPAYMSFLLLADRQPLDTIVSRSQVYRLGLLARDELFDVLTEVLDVPPGLADRAAELGRGQVSRALQADELDNARAAVLSVLKAVKDGDVALLEAAASSFDEVSVQLMMTWIVEAITGRWLVFTSEVTGVHGALPGEPGHQHLNDLVVSHVSALSVGGTVPQTRPLSTPARTRRTRASPRYHLEPERPPSYSSRGRTRSQ